MKEVPLFVINGFLESGKTTLIKEIIENNENYKGYSTVVITTEEGEVEYDQEWLDENEVHLVVVDDQDEFTPEFIRLIDTKYHPKQYVLEYNSFFDYENQEFPNYMVIYQQITLIDASKFSVMFNNMRNIFNTMVKYSSLVIFNRCGQNLDLAGFRRQIRGLNQQAQIAFEGADGRLTTMLDEDLPYDLTKDVIAFEDDIYPTWYVDVFDNYEKYFNKTFKFKAYVRDILEERFVLGRQVMTCCADDIQFLGYEVINESGEEVKKDELIYIECEVTRGYSDIANDEVVLLKAKKISHLPYEKEEAVSL